MIVLSILSSKPPRHLESEQSVLRSRRSQRVNLLVPETCRLDNARTKLVYWLALDRIEDVPRTGHPAKLNGLSGKIFAAF